MPELMPRVDAATLAKLEGTVSIKELYKLDEKSGMATLDVKPHDGWALENIKGLTTTIDATRHERDEHNKALNELRKQTEGLDLSKARDALKRIEAIEKGGVDERTRTQIDAALAGVHQETSKKIGDLETQLKKRQGNVERLLVDSKLAELCSQQEFDVPVKVAGPLLKPYIGVNYDEVKDEFNVVVKDANGVPRSVVRDGASHPMGLKDLLLEFRNDPEYSIIFKGTGAKGTGSPGSNGARGLGEFVMTKSQAQDHRAYTAMSDAAAKAGKFVQIIGD